ncbi:MAG: PD-(D/E)XK nuclease family transposase [Lachnospiraceae bacterium]|nr:PD-(D/E)XK nuclease family transposase [Lachnospiraceae bacterium]
MSKKSEQAVITVRKRKHSPSDLFGRKRSRSEVMSIIISDPQMKAQYDRLKPEMKEQVVGFLEGSRSLCILYDNFFRKIFDPYIHEERVEKLLSALLGQNVRIKDVLSRDGFEIIEGGSLVIMDIVVELENGSIVNVEMQKIGYMFPSQRSSCYAADIIMRQYNKKKKDRGDKFTYRDICPVYLFIIMERSPDSFKDADSYITKREVSYSSGITLPETANITYITLDKFNEKKDNKSDYNKKNKELDTWLTFLSKDDMKSVLKLVDDHPEFAEIYPEIALFRNDPREVMNMFSEALAFLDKNTERYMVDYYAEKAEKAEEKAEAETVRADKAEEKAKNAESKITSEKQASAIRMLKDGQSMEKVSEYLNISMKEVDHIKNEIDNS